MQNCNLPALDYVIDRINQRLIINTYEKRELRAQIAAWLAIANNNCLEKIWIWSDLTDIGIFISHGFIVEGVIADSPQGSAIASMAYFVESTRQKSTKVAQENDIIHSISNQPFKTLLSLPANLTLRLLTPQDCQSIAALLTEVFVSYPTPISDVSYIKSLFTKGCLFAGAIHEQRNLVAVAAAYPDSNFNRCEITDCATLAQFRGFSLTSRLIPLLETKLGSAFTFYTLARATSWGINRTFYRIGYRLQGRLINNCHIAGSFEDMNLLVKGKTLPPFPTAKC